MSSTKEDVRNYGAWMGVAECVHGMLSTSRLTYHLDVSVKGNLEKHFASYVEVNHFHCHYVKYNSILARHSVSALSTDFHIFSCQRMISGAAYTSNTTDVGQKYEAVPLHHASIL